MSQDDPPVCRTKADIEAHDGERVAVVGTYKQVDMNAHPRRDPVYVGHVGIEIEDTTVHLGPSWDDDTKRPDEEIDRLEGDQARVVGKIQADMPEPPQERFMFTGPCLHPVDVLEDVE